MLQSSKLLSATYSDEISGSLACPCDTLAIANSCFQATFDILIIVYPVPIFRKMKLDRRTRSEYKLPQPSNFHILIKSSSWPNNCLLSRLLHACHDSHSPWRRCPLHSSGQFGRKASGLLSFLHLGNSRS